jgi:hypothetical protein
MAIGGHRVRWCVAALAALAAVAATALTVPTAPVRAADGPNYAGGGEYHPLTPVRIFDSRPDGPSLNDVAPIGAKPLGAPGVATFDIDVLGLGGLPADPGQVLAVVLNITVTAPGAAGYLKAVASGENANAGQSSIVNFAKGQTVPNVAIVRPGGNGKVTIGLYGQSGTAHVIVDVFGWFSLSTVAAGEGARLIPVTPGRIYDTRDDVSRVPPKSPLGAGETITVPIRGADAYSPTVVDLVPDSPDVIGVVVNVTAIASLATFVSVLPENLPLGEAPTTSNLNLAGGAVRANLVFAPLGADGAIRIYNHAPGTHVIVDVVGYLEVTTSETSRKGRVVPLTAPFRTFDTREPQWGSAALGPGQGEDWSFAQFAASVNIGGVAVGNQLAVIGNLTSAELKRQYATVPVVSYLTLYPPDAPRPTTSNLNSFEGVIVPNLALLTYGPNQTVRVYNASGNAHYLFDASAVVLAD